jgi:NADPH:quinone reductase-like Zn-dependent oxidoreductase
MLRAVEHHEVRPVIDRVFPFADLRAALQYLKSGRHFGKVCVAM